MKKILKSSVSVLLTLAFIFAFVSCGHVNSVEKTGLWENATYLEDTTIKAEGGDKTIEVEVKADNQSLTFTLVTSAENLGDALLESKLASGTDGEYGLYVDTVNGMKADYGKNQSFWAFTVDGKMSDVGVSSTKLTDGAHYELTYTIYVAEATKTGVWENATYLKDTTFSKENATKTIRVQVVADGQAITFTVATSAENLADALLENKLISGSDSEWGLMIDTVNGIKADYSVDRSWWALTEDGKMSEVGASSLAIKDGGHYEFTYTPYDTGRDGLWANATYTQDTKLGDSGDKTITVSVNADGQYVNLTVTTAEKTLADALTKSGIASGAESEWGLMIDTVNGIKADYAKDGSYWLLNKDGAASEVGASSIEIKDGDKYEFVYTIYVNSIQRVNVWKDAKYDTDMNLSYTSSEATAKNFDVLVLAQGQYLTFHVTSFLPNLAESLVELGLISGSDTEWGLMVDTVNGIKADYAKNGSWWAFMVNGEMSNVGISSVETEEGAVYSLVYTITPTEVKKEGVWANAAYTTNTIVEDKEAAHFFYLTVEAEGQHIMFEVQTSESNLGKALVSTGLVSGAESEWGLMIDTVNGIKADYAVNQSWWALTVNGAMSEVGVSGIEIADGESYEFTYTVG